MQLSDIATVRSGLVLSVNKRAIRLVRYHRNLVVLTFPKIICLKFLT